MPRKDLEHYWSDRIEERTERNAKLTLQETEKLLAEIYEDQGLKIENEILKVLSKIQDQPQEVIPNDYYRNDRYWKLWDYVRDRLNILGKKQLKIMNPALAKVYEDTKKIIAEEVPQEIIKSRFLVPSAIDATQVIHQVWCLDGKEFSDRIWDDKAKLLNSLKKNLSTYLVQGKSNFYIAEQIQKEMATSQYNAYRIARTETAHLQIKAKTDKYQEMGFTKGEYVGTKCCDICKEKNGKIYTLKELESMIPVHPHCTCTFTLVVD